MFEKGKRIFWSKRSKYVTSAVLEVLVVVAIGLIWWVRSSDNPQGVFWSAVSNALSTNAVTIESSLTQSGESQTQLIQIDFGQHPEIRTLTTLTANKALVQTEDIDTGTAEYTRYLKIETPHKAKNGKPVNFSSILGLWSKTGTSSSGGTLPSNLGQIVLALSLPFGNLTNIQKSNLLSAAKANQTFDVSFKGVKKQTLNRRSVYVYHLSIQPILYVNFMKQYASDVGLKQLNQVDANSYGGEPPIQVTWTVDALTRRLVEAKFGGNHVEKFAGYGIPVSVKLPSYTVSSQTLQGKLAKLLE